MHIKETVVKSCIEFVKENGLFLNELCSWYIRPSEKYVLEHFCV